MNQFRIRGYKVFRRDVNCSVGGLMLYINENIPSRPLSDHPIFSDLELIAIEIHKKKTQVAFSRYLQTTKVILNLRINQV